MFVEWKLLITSTTRIVISYLIVGHKDVVIGFFETEMRSKEESTNLVILVFNTNIPERYICLDNTLYTKRKFTLYPSLKHFMRRMKRYPVYEVLV